MPMTYIQQRKAEAREKGYCSQCLNISKRPLPGKTICQACDRLILDFKARTLKAQRRLIKTKRNSTGRLYDKIIAALGSACARCSKSDVRLLNIDHKLGGGSHERS